MPFIVMLQRKGQSHQTAPSNTFQQPPSNDGTRNYKNGGFDALIPQGRVDEGKPRKLNPDLQEQIKYLKQNYPRMSASAIFRQLHDNGSIITGEVAESTVNRYINQLAIELKTTTNPDMRRYERPHINEVWCGDSSMGPYLKTDDGKKHKVYIIALIDDASRFIVGIDVFFNDNFVNLMSVMKSAVAKYGRPQIFNFDNGKSYRNKQMELLAARIGSVLHYDQPYTPTQKAKIERWFRTMKDQWMSSLDIRDFHTLDELRGNLLAYVNTYTRSPSSLKENLLMSASSQSRGASTAFPMMSLIRTSFWKSNAVFPLTV